MQLFKLNLYKQQVYLYKIYFLKNYLYNLTIETYKKKYPYPSINVLAKFNVT